MTIQIPIGAQKIIDLLNNAGYEAYIVGGCVRDSIMGRTPKDWDITTSATPEQMEAVIESFMFPNNTDLIKFGIYMIELIPTGIAFGTVTFVVQMMDHPAVKETYEVTTFRSDGEYSDGRHPDTVTYSKTLEDDLSRRDFTMNAMAYHPDHGLLDRYCGKECIEAGEIHTVGGAKARFMEDKLRMMRAVRFSAQLNFTLSKDIHNAISKMAPLIHEVSAERIRDELTKIITSPNPSIGIQLLNYTGLLEEILPELDDCVGFKQDNPWHVYDVFEHSMVAFEHICHEETTLIERLAVLLHDIGKIPSKIVGEDGIGHFPGHPIISAQMATDIMRRLRFSNEQINSVSALIEYHDTSLRPEKPLIKRVINRLGNPDLFPMLVRIRLADIAAHNPLYASDGRSERAIASLDVYKEILAEMSAMKVTDLVIDGTDIMNLGFKGREIGHILRTLLDLVIDEIIPNNGIILTRIAEAMVPMERCPLPEDHGPYKKEK